MDLPKIAGKNIQFFEAYYKQIDPKNVGAIEAMVAAKFLKKSGLSDVALSRIWDLSDPNGRGSLDKEGFFVAIKLVGIAQAGHDVNIRNIYIDIPKPPKIGDLPKIMPPKIQTVQPTIADWSIKPEDKQKYEQLFASLHPVDGYLMGNQVKVVLMDSKLPFDILSRIWDLADQDRDGNLSKPEFLIAMHLVYQALDQKAIPSSLPAELQKELVADKQQQQQHQQANIVSLETDFVADFPDEIPAPVVQPLPVANSWAKPEPVLMAPTPAIMSQSNWVVPHSDKARFEAMFLKSDLDHDGLVSGVEIKDVFLQSGIENLCLAKIWALCDTNQSGKLTSEQFCLAMWLVEQKQKGIDPPDVLAPNMVPPSLRADKKIVELNQMQPIQPTREPFSNPELELIYKEIEKITSERTKLEHEIMQKEADIRIKNGELKSLQSELDTLTATLKQLETQKVEAEKRLNDLKAQVTKIRTQCQKQEEIIKEQETEVNARRDELQKLKDAESTLEREYQNNQNEVENLSKLLQSTQLQISQVKTMVIQLQESQKQMSNALELCKSAVNSDDISMVSDYSLSLDADFRETKRAFEEKESKLSDPFNDNLSKNNSSSANNNAFDANGRFDAAFGSDPFAAEEDPFGDSMGVQHTKDNDPNKDDFGCDPFAVLHAPTAATLNSSPKSGPPPRPESPSPALPPKKAKQPPPRPAPPRPLQGPTRTEITTNEESVGSFADFSNFESKVVQVADFSDDPFKDYRYEDPFSIEDPFDDKVFDKKT